MVEIGKRLKSTAALLGTRSVPDLVAAAGLDPDGDGGPGSLSVAAAAATAAARRFLLLDLRSVVGIDATTASSFALLRRSLETRGVTMVLTGLRGDDGVTRLLQSNGVIAKGGAWESGYGCPAFESFDGALVWCEEHFMKVRGRSRGPARPPNGQAHGMRTSLGRCRRVPDALDLSPRGIVALACVIGRI